MTGYRTQFSMAIAIGTAFTFAEFALAYRTDYWLGVEALAWTGAFLGWLAYVGVVAVLACVFFALLTRLPSHAKAIRHAAAVLGGIVTAIWLWSLGSVPANVLAMLVGLSGAVGAVVWVAGCRRGRWAAAALAVAWSFACGMAVLVGAHRIFMLAVDDLAMAGIVAATATAAFVALALLLAVQANKKRYAAAIGLTCFAIPWIISAARALPAEPRSTGPHNLVLIVIDTLRAKSLDIYGGPVPTPAMDALSERGALFTKSLSVSNWTAPSMLGLFYSQYVPATSMEHAADALSEGHEPVTTPQNARALASLLQEAGYTSGAYIANTIVHTETMTAGYEDVRSYNHAATPSTPLFSRLPLIEGVAVNQFPSLRKRRKVDTSSILTSEGTMFLRRTANEPFVLWLQYMAPHTPYAPPHRYRTASNSWNIYDPDFAWDDRTNPLRQLNDEEKRFVAELYRGEVRYADEHLGRVLSELDRLGLRENTIVCVTSDHGQELFERGEQGHGLSMYRDQIWIPLIIAGPGVKPQKIAEPIPGIDIMPTLAGLLGIETHEAWAGESWAPILTGQDMPDDHSRTALSHGAHTKNGRSSGAVALSGDHKLIRFDDGTVELFNLRVDPNELKNVADDHPEIRDRLLAELRAADSSITMGEGPETRQEAEDAQERIERLRSLGYID